jgi:hypothetical protein
LFWWIWAVMVLNWWLHIHWLCGKLDVKMLVLMRVICDNPYVKSFSCIKISSTVSTLKNIKNAFFKTTQE